MHLSELRKLAKKHASALTHAGKDLREVHDDAGAAINRDHWCPFRDLHLYRLAIDDVDGRAPKKPIAVGRVLRNVSSSEPSVDK